MKYDVTVAGPGGYDIVTVEAASGDEAANKAYKRGAVIRGVHPHEPVEAPAKPVAKSA
jgi:hypothetical protein